MDEFSNHTSKHNFVAKKSLGQNFLHAPHIVGKMIHSARIEAGDTVLEVGPGKGVLTQGLLDRGARVIAVEKDDRAIIFLQEKFAEVITSGKLTIIHEDILTFEPEKHGLEKGTYTIAANIPYYITGEFLRKFLTSPIYPEKMVLMLQKEVAKRITSEKESILSLSVKAYGTPVYIDTVPARHFRPVPNVDSAVLLIDHISKDFFKETSTIAKGMAKNGSIETSFFTIIKAGFAHKRKVLIKNLEIIAPRSVLMKIWQKNSWSLTIRAENVPLANWKLLAEILAEQISAHLEKTHVK